MVGDLNIYHFSRHTLGSIWCDIRTFWSVYIQLLVLVTSDVQASLLPHCGKRWGWGKGGGVCNPTFGFRDVIVVCKDKAFNEHPVMHATGRQKCSMIMIWCNCRFCLCPMAKVLVMFTCKIHFIRSPGAIIAVVQTPAKNPEVRI